MSRQIELAILQVEQLADESPFQRMKRVEQLILQQKGADLILLPEMWKCGFHNSENYYATAEPLDGKTVTMLSKAAAALHAYIHGGSIITREGDNYYNTSLFFDRYGELIATYKKVHLFGYQSLEGKLLTNGEAVTVVETDFGKVGLATCYDLRFPEQFRKMVDEGAELFLIAADWSGQRTKQWKLFNQVRALENQCFLAACDCAEGCVTSHIIPAAVDTGSRHAGHSMVVDPWGSILAEAELQETALRCTIDLGMVDEVREEFPVLRDRVEME